MAKKSAASPEQQALMASLLAYSNLAFPKLQRNRLDWQLKYPRTSLDSIMSDIAGHILESDEQLDMCVDEAKEWLKIIRKNSDREIERKYGDIWRIVMLGSPEVPR
jgi:hypothetical protein